MRSEKKAATFPTFSDATSLKRNQREAARLETLCRVEDETTGMLPQIASRLPNTPLRTGINAETGSTFLCCV